MTAKNDITNDSLRSKANNDNFNSNFDRIFGKKAHVKTGRIPVSEPSSVAAEASAADRDGAGHAKD
jgi:hypothetical protein